MGSLKVGDKAIVVKCNSYADKCKYKAGIVVQIESDGFKRENFVFPYLIRLGDGCEVWCRAIPCSSLIEELF
jgi:hypothetical protein